MYTMVVINTLVCAAHSPIDATIAVALTDPMTGLPSVMPAGAAVIRVAIYRDGESAVTSGCAIQLGIVNEYTKYISTADAVTTTVLNTGSIVSKQPALDVGAGESHELRITLNNQFTTGTIMVELMYMTA